MSAPSSRVGAGGPTPKTPRSNTRRNVAAIAVLVLVALTGFYYYANYVNVTNVNVSIDVGGDTNAYVSGAQATMSGVGSCTVSIPPQSPYGSCQLKIPNGGNVRITVTLTFRSQGCAYPHISNSNNAEITYEPIGGQCIASGGTVEGFLVTSTGQGNANAGITFGSTP